MKYVLPVLLTIGCVVLDHLFLAEMERGNHPKAVRLKGLASLCFVLTGLWFTIFAGGGKHHLLIAFGLVLGLVGDVLLAMRFEYPEKHDQYFLIGAISFALGHVLYIAALLGVNGRAWLPAIPFWVGLLAIAGVSALRCKADAGKMQIPGYRRKDASESLYSTGRPAYEPQTLTAIPYFAWANREPKDMRVWIRE